MLEYVHKNDESSCKTLPLSRSLRLSLIFERGVCVCVFDWFLILLFFLSSIQNRNSFVCSDRILLITLFNCIKFVF